MMFCASENKRVCHSKMTIVISMTLWCEWPPCVVSLAAILSWSSPSWTLIGPRVVLMVTEVESSPNWRWQRAHASLLFSMESLGNNDNTTISELFDNHPAVSSQCAIDPWYLNFKQKKENAFPREWFDMVKRLAECCHYCGFAEVFFGLKLKAECFSFLIDALISLLNVLWVFRICVISFLSAL